MPVTLPSHRTRKYLLFVGGLFVGVLLALSLLLKACESLPESSFTLANDSRLPKWITLPSGLQRANASVTMNYYLFPSSYATFIVKDAKEQVVQKDTAKDNCEAGFQLKNLSSKSSDGYPAYKPFTVNGITEIIEHRKMEPIFYLTDDPTVWKQYQEFGCG